MEVAIAGYGSRGDVEPLAAVGRELSRRGHGVRMAVPPNLLGFVESAGLAATQYGSDPRADPNGKAVSNNTPHSPVGAMLDFVRRYTVALAEWSATLTALAKGADLLLTGTNEQGLAANVAEHYGIPSATLHFFPGHARPGGWIGQVAADTEAEQRRSLGLPGAAGARPSLQIQAYDEVCFPGLREEWARQGVEVPFVGSLTLASPADADAEVMAWIAAGPPPIYFGFGSNTPVPYPALTVAMISAGCAELGERALIVSGASEFANQPHPDHVKIVDAVNHATVFPACRAVVHHGGAGTTAAGLRAGVPTLILWSEVDDQPIWGAVVTQLEAGLGQPFSSTTQESLIEALRAVLAPHCLTRAGEVAALLTTPAESAAKVADLLEAAQAACRQNG